MNPYILKLKNTEVYLYSDEDHFCSLVPKEKAVIYRSHTNNCTSAILSHRWFMTKNADIIKMLDDAGYTYQKYESGYIGIRLEQNQVEKVDLSSDGKKESISGKWVIKVKGTELYLRPTTDQTDSLTTEKSEAKVFSNTGTDPIGKLSKGMKLSGTAVEGETPMKYINIGIKSSRGKKVCEYILNHKDFFYDIKEDTYRPEKPSVIDAIMWGQKVGVYMISANIPVELLEREML